MGREEEQVGHIGKLSYVASELQFFIIPSSTVRFSRVAGRNGRTAEGLLLDYSERARVAAMRMRNTKRRFFAVGQHRRRSIGGSGSSPLVDERLRTGSPRSRAALRR